MSEHIDAYRIPPGPALDRRIHHDIFGNDSAGDIPPYSTDDQLAKQVLKRIRNRRSRSFATGKTKIRGGTW